MELELLRSTEKDFPHIEHPLRVKEARIVHCKFRSLAPLKEFKNLTDLEVQTVPDDSFEFLLGLNKLKRLRISHFPRVASIEPVGTLSNLVDLELSALFSWFQSSKKLTVKSFKPIAKLSKLKRLDLAGVVPKDGDVLALRKCTELREVSGFGDTFPLVDYVKFLASLPKLKKSMLQPTKKLGGVCCKKHSVEKVWLVAAEAPAIICPLCQPTKYHAHIERWNAIVEKTAAKRPSV